MPDVAPPTALVVLVPEAEPLVGRHRLLHDSSAADGMPAHVTVLWPFAPEPAFGAAQAARLADALARVPAFDVRFRRTARFGEAVLWLAPEPRERFDALLRAVWAAFPEHPPYGGSIPDVVPHLTVADRGTAALLDAVERELDPAFDIVCRVSRVDHMALRDGRWTTLRRFGLAAA